LGLEWDEGPGVGGATIDGIGVGGAGSWVVVGAGSSEVTLAWLSWAIPSNATVVRKVAANNCFMSCLLCRK
jgi:hypothetical protein